MEFASVHLSSLLYQGAKIIISIHLPKSPVPQLNKLLLKVVTTEDRASMQPKIDTRHNPQ
jgi:hypothetical protein